MGGVGSKEDKQDLEKEIEKRLEEDLENYIDEELKEVKKLSKYNGL